MSFTSHYQPIYEQHPSLMGLWEHYSTAQSTHINVAQHRKTLEPQLAEGIEWEGAEHIHAAEETTTCSKPEATNNPEAFATTLTNEESPGAKRLLVAKLRKALEPNLQKMGLEMTRSARNNRVDDRVARPLSACWHSKPACVSVGSSHKSWPAWTLTPGVDATFDTRNFRSDQEHCE